MSFGQGREWQVGRRGCCVLSTMLLRLPWCEFDLLGWCLLPGVSCSWGLKGPSAVELDRRLRRHPLPRVGLRDARLLPAAAVPLLPEPLCGWPFSTMGWISPPFHARTLVLHDNRRPGLLSMSRGSDLPTPEPPQAATSSWSSLQKTGRRTQHSTPPPAPRPAPPQSRAKWASGSSSFSLASRLPGFLTDKEGSSVLSDGCFLLVA